ncbi:MAG: winged helix-turn-helix domain-containing protein [Dysgonomonas sp.]
MLKELIAQDADSICQLLLRRKSLTIDELREATGYRDMYIYLVIGWLTKEDKIICLDGGGDLNITLKNKA